VAKAVHVLTSFHICGMARSITDVISVSCSCCCAAKRRKTKKAHISNKSSAKPTQSHTNDKLRLYHILYTIERPSYHSYNEFNTVLEDEPYPNTNPMRNDLGLEVSHWPFGTM
jgi:hypothetical protein